MPLRPRLPLLAAMLLLGCTDTSQERRLAAEGPWTIRELAATRRPLQAGERIALLLLGAHVEPDRLRSCIAAGLAAGLPPDQPAPAWLDGAEAGAVAALLAASREGARPRLPRTGHDWLVAIEDRTSSGPVDVPPTAEAGFGGVALGANLAQPVGYHLELRAEILDLRGAGRVGTVASRFDATERREVIVALVGGGMGALPIILPVTHRAGGTDALAICDAFGRGIAAGLLYAERARQGAAPAARP